MMKMAIAEGSDRSLWELIATWFPSKGRLSNNSQSIYNERNDAVANR